MHSVQSGPHQRFRRTVASVLMTAACVLAITAGFQEAAFGVSREGYTGRGVAAITDGDIAAARQKALVDAQEKAVLQAVSAVLPMKEITKYCLVLAKLFIANPDLYLQRYKILSEQAQLDRYTVSIQGFVSQEQLTGDLESMGMLARRRKQQRILFMVAERHGEEEEETYWWSETTIPGSNAGTVVSQRLSDFFAARGFAVINPLTLNPEDIPPSVRKTAAPGIEELCSYAASVHADMVIAGIARLSKAESKRFASIEGMQCDMELRAVDVWKKDVAVQSTAHALGLHIDETSAALDAVDKAARQIAGTIIDTVYLHMRGRHEYVFELVFTQAAQEAEARVFLDRFTATVPDMAFSNLNRNVDTGHWSVVGISALESAGAIQQILEKGIDGYTVDITPASEEAVRFTITPAAGQGS